MGVNPILSFPPTLEDKVKMHKDICNKLNEIYEKKNSDYKDAFSKTFNEYGIVVSCIREEDKLTRLKSLTSSDANQKVLGESIEDTLIDMANYAIMTLLEMGINKEDK